MEVVSETLTDPIERWEENGIHVARFANGLLIFGRSEAELDERVALHR